MGADHTLLRDLLEIADDPRGSVNDFFARLASTPGLAEEIVRVGNSSLFGMEGRIGRLERVVLILGLQATTAIVGCLLLRSDPSWPERLELACGSRILAHELGLGDEHRAFLAGLIGGLGLPSRSDPNLDRLVAAAHGLAHGGRGDARGAALLREFGLCSGDRDALRATLESRLKDALRALAIPS